MIRYLSLLLIGVFLLSCTESRNVIGEYQERFPSYGMFSHVLKLKCNGEAALIFAGDLMRDSSFAKWKKTDTYIVLSFDTTGKSQRFKENDTLVIKGKRLYRNHMSRDIYNKASKFADSLKMKNFPKYSHLNDAPKDFKGHMGKQYYTLVKKDSLR